MPKNLIAAVFLLNLCLIKIEIGQISNMAYLTSMYIELGSIKIIIKYLLLITNSVSGFL